MAYRLNLNCADRIRFAELAKKAGVCEEDYAKSLIHDFFQSWGVKNPPNHAKIQSSFSHINKV